MSYDYSSLLSTAGRLITRFGVNYTFTRTTAGSYSAATGTTSDSSSTYQKYGVFSKIQSTERLDNTVLQVDKEILAEAYTYEIGDTVSISSKVYRLVNIENIQKGDTLLAVKLGFKR